MSTFTERLELLVTSNTRDGERGMTRMAGATDDLTGKQKLLGGAQGAVSAGLERFGISADAAGSALKFAAAGAGALVAVKLGQFAVDAAGEFKDLGVQILNFQRVSGASAEDSSRWVAALDDMGISADKGGTAAFKLGKEVAAGGEKLATFGIEVARNKDGTTDLSGTLLNVADAYRNTGDASERTALLTAAFGKAGKDLIPLLEGGSKAIKELFEGAESGHQIFSQNDLKNAEAYRLALDHMDDSMRGFKLAIGGAVAPTLTALTDGIAGGIDTVDTAAASFGGLGGAIKHTVAFAGAFTPVSNVMNIAATATNLASGNFLEAGHSAIKALPLIGNAVSGIESLFGGGGDEADKFSDAQTRVSDATTKVLDLQQQGKAGTHEYAAAVRDARTASDELEGTQRKVARAFEDEATSALNAQAALLNHAAGVIDVAQKTLAARDAADAYQAALVLGAGPNETAEAYTRRLEKANLDAQASLLGVIDAAGKKAVADAGPNATASEIAAAATAGQQQAIIDMANTVPGAIGALDALGFRVITLPDGKQIVVTADTEDARRKLEALKTQLGELVGRAFGSGMSFHPFGGGEGAPPPPPGPGFAFMRMGAAGPELMYPDDGGGSGFGGLGIDGPTGSGFGGGLGGFRVAQVVFNATVNVTTTGLGADAPEIQRAVVAALRNYADRNGPLTDLVVHP